MASENRAQEIWGGSNSYYHSFQDASDRLANNPASPSGVTYDFEFATNVVRATAGLIAQEAGLVVAADLCDFDLNGICDIADLNDLLGQDPVEPGVTVTPGLNGQFDVSGDGVIDNADVNLWLADAANAKGSFDVFCLTAKRSFIVAQGPRRSRATLGLGTVVCFAP